ncbi:hypothetical protein Bbelb_215900 [Branchiostoma belcheri]|nr:hypothetical protein Bbelb_215900 [Branchiostoma belcheri]
MSTFQRCRLQATTLLRLEAWWGEIWCKQAGNMSLLSFEEETCDKFTALIPLTFPTRDMTTEAACRTVASPVGFGRDIGTTITVGSALRTDTDIHYQQTQAVQGQETRLADSFPMTLSGIFGEIAILDRRPIHDFLSTSSPLRSPRTHPFLSNRRTGVTSRQEKSPTPENSELRDKMRGLPSARKKSSITGEEASANAAQVSF